MLEVMIFIIIIYINFWINREKDTLFLCLERNLKLRLNISLIFYFCFSSTTQLNRNCISQHISRFDFAETKKGNRKETHREKCVQTFI